MGFQHSWWNISMSILVILAASVFEISFGKTDRQTDKRRWTPYLATIVSVTNKPKTRKLTTSDVKRRWTSWSRVKVCWVSLRSAISVLGSGITWFGCGTQSARPAVVSVIFCQQKRYMVENALKSISATRASTQTTPGKPKRPTRHLADSQRDNWEGEKVGKWCG